MSDFSSVPETDFNDPGFLPSLGPVRQPTEEYTSDVELSPDLIAEAQGEARKRDQQFLDFVRSDPDLAAEAKAHGLELGVDSEVAKRNIQRVRELVQRKRIEDLELAKNYPILHRQMLDPDFAELAIDDFDKLTWFERWSAGWESGGIMVELGELGTLRRQREERGLKLSEKEWTRYQELDRRMTELGNVDGFFGMTGQTVGQMAHTPGTMAANVGATVGSVLFPPAAPFLILGAAGNSMHTAYTIEGGLAYHEYRKAGMAPHIAMRNSHTVGLINGLVEVGSLGLAGKPFVAAGRNFARRSGVVRRLVGNALSKPTATRAWSKLVGRGAFQLSQEVGQEVIQENVTALGLYYGQKSTEAFDEFDREWVSGRIDLPGGGYAQIVQGTDEIEVSADVYYRVMGTKLPKGQVGFMKGDTAERFLKDLRELYPLESTLSDDKFWTDVWQLSMDTAGQAVQGVGVISQIGPALQHFSELKRVRSAKEQAKAYAEVRDGVSDSKLQQRDSSKMALLLRRMWGDTKMHEVHIARDVFEKTLSDAGVTVEEVEAIFPGLEEQLAKEPTEQPNVVLDGASFFTEFAGTDLQEMLFEHIKPDADTYSLFETKQEEDRIKAERDRIKEGAKSVDSVQQTVDKDVDALAEMWTKQAREAGANAQVANDAAALTGALLRRAAEHASEGRDTLVLPSELAAELGMDVENLFTKGEDFSPRAVFSQFAGVESETAPNIQEAHDMAMAGASAQDIRLKTGWFIGPDGSPRYEISDERARLIPLKKDIPIADAFHAPTQMDMEDVLDHPEVFAAYPALRGYRVEFKRMPKNSLGYANPSKKVIGLNITRSKQEILSTLLHEVQHAIQHEEGFASGGGPASFNSEQKAQVTVADIRKLMAEVDEDGTLSPEHGALVHQLLDLRLKITETGAALTKHTSQVASKYGEQPDPANFTRLEERYRMLSAELNGIYDKVTAAEEDPAFRDVISRLWKIESGGRDGYVLYERLAGEAEARAVQARQNFTDEERADIPFDRTLELDVKEGRQALLFRFNDGSGGYNMALDFDPAPKNSTKFKQILTTTVPTGVAGQNADPTDVQLPRQERALDGNIKQQEKNLALFGAREATQTKNGKPVTKRTYDGVKVEGSTPKEKSDSIVRHMVSNLQALFDAVPPEIRQRSKLWYDGANRMATELASRYGLDLTQTAGMLAVMSPQADWRMNVSYVERVLDALTYFADIQLTDEMDAWAAEWVKGSEANEAAYAEMKGGTLNSLKGKRAAQALWIRAFDQFNNSKAFREIAPEGELLGFVKTKKGADLKIGWKSLDATINALSIYDDPSNLHEALGEQHKVRNFYHNIFAPNSDTPFVTADTHQVAANLMLPLGGNAYEVSHNLAGAGSAKDGALGLRGTYWLYHEAVVQAAESRGVKPREMQSISWEAVRGLFHDVLKRNKDVVADIRDLWLEYEAGNQTHADTIKKIFDRAAKEGGDVTRPFWTGVAPGSGGALEAGYRTYESQLPLPDGAGNRQERPGDAGDTGRNVRPEDGGAPATSEGPRRSATHQRHDPVYRQRGEVTKGEFDPDTFRIFLHKKHDASTFAHELAHMRHEIDAAMFRKGIAGKQQVRDMQTLLDELGDGKFSSLEDYATSSMDDRRVMHERVARSFETYMAENKAPSEALRDVFRRMSTWIVRVYRKIRDGIAAEHEAQTGDPLPALTDDVRNVFDRWLAAEEEIDVRNREAMLGRLIRGQDIDELDQLVLDELVFEHEHTAKEQLRKVFQKELHALRDQRTRIWRELQVKSRKERRRIEEEVRTDARAGLLKDQPALRTLHYLMTGQQVDIHGTVDNEDARLELEKGARMLFTEDDRIPKRLRTSNFDNALIRDVEEFAVEEGFASAEEMFAKLHEILQNQDDAEAAFEAAVQDETDKRMLAEVPHLADADQMQFEIDAAISNEAMLKVRAAEFAILQKQPKAWNEMKRVAKAAAEADVAELTAGELFGRKNLIRKFTSEARAAERKAWASRGDPIATGQHQRTALYMRAKAKAAADARLRLEKTGTKLQKQLRYSARNGKREDQLGRAFGGATVETARRMMRLLGIETGTGFPDDYVPWSPLPEDSPERLELEVAYQDMKSLVDTRGQFTELSVAEAWEALQYVEGVLGRARSLRQFEIDGRKLDMDRVVEILTAKADDENRPKRARKAPKSLRLRAKAKVREWRNQSQRIEHMLFALDGDRQGALSQSVFVPIREAEDNVELAFAAVTARLVPLLQGVRDQVGSNAELSKPITTDVDATGAPLLPDRSQTTDGPDSLDSGKLDVLGLLLHVGNESNLQRLLDGFGWERDRFFQQIEEWSAGGVITAADWEFVQGVWDIYEEELLPMTKQAHYDLIGRDMPLVDKGIPELAEFGVKGGYVPAYRDPDLRSPKGNRNAQNELLNFQKSIPTVNRGMTKARVDEEVPDPLDIDPLRQIMHFRKAIVFSQMAPAHRKVANLVQNKDVAEALERLQPGISREIIDPFLQTAASLSSKLEMGVSADPLSGLDFVDKIRSRYGTAAMFAHVVNALQGVFGPIIALPKVGFRHMREGMAAGPPKDEIYKVSKFMRVRHRLGVSAFELQQQAVALVRDGKFRKVEEAREWLSRNTYWAQEIIQKPVDLVVWKGAYVQALANGKTENQAIREADGAVRTTQSDSAVTSMSSVEKGNRLQKLLTQFSSWFLSAIGSPMASSLRRAQIAVKDKPDTARRDLEVLARLVVAKEMMAGLVTLYLSELIVEGLKGEAPEDETAADAWLLNPMQTTLLAVPRAFGPVGNVTSTLVATLIRAEAHQQRMPAPAPVAVLTKMLRSVTRLVDDDSTNDKTAAVDMVESLGLLMGLPVQVMTQRLRRGVNVFGEEKFDSPTPISLLTGRR